MTGLAVRPSLIMPGLAARPSPGFLDCLADRFTDFSYAIFKLATFISVRELRERLKKLLLFADMFAKGGQPLTRNRLRKSTKVSYTAPYNNVNRRRKSP